MKFAHFLTILLLFNIILFSPFTYSQDISEIETCLDCHGEEDITGEINGEEVSVYVNGEKYENSIHGGFSCVDCHEDIEEIPHAFELERVDCTRCHFDVMDTFTKSVHGEAAFNRKDQFAPTCGSCHGVHDVLPPSNPESKTYIMNIPSTCGQCHKEGTKMTETHEIDQHNVVSNYSMSIHGEGLFERGLVVTAVCTSCHGSHNILPHQNPDSKINENNVVDTCKTCHAQIERVHEKIIEGQLWEKEPGKIPICIECHSPHKIRRVYYEDIQISDRVCMTCHRDPNLTMKKDGETISLYVDQDKLEHSIHADTSCVKCHFDVHPDNNPVCKDSEPVDCSVCHAEQVDNHKQSIHGLLETKGDKNAPSCLFCHGSHDILSKKNQDSPTFPRNVPTLCSRCHADGQPAALLRDATSEEHIIESYSMSIHGKGLIESGLMVSAICTDCHTTHKQLPSSNPKSSVHPKNVGQTCGECHLGIYEQFRTSIHSFEANPTEEELPGCNDCHQSHAITRVDETDFRTEIIQQCGQCHMELTDSYFQTYHGKVTKLGGVLAAKCYDCHGSHKIFPISDPRSTLHRENIVDTCKQCHPSSHRKFTGYLTHATHHDSENYPLMYYSFWFMTSLLIGTLGFFGIHTLLWLIRSLIFHYREKEHIHPRSIIQTDETKYFRRFQLRHRITHIFVIVSFMSLAITGMILKFPDVPLFEFLSRLLGGPQTMGIIHRTGAIITFGYFGTHLFFLFRMMKRKEMTMKDLFYGENTMLPTWRDVQQLIENFKWFLGLGPRPSFGRWTYWEKFDYFAVFWGVAIIGVTGLILWFPEEVTLILPGWIINVATVIHSDEALLAAGFIFTIHFFNTHFRPGVFPMDPVIFTGRIPLEEFKEERPHEYQQLVESGELEKHIVGPPPKWVAWTSVVCGFTFLAIGLIIVATILYGMVFVYS